jgi:hypothetical protein
MLDIGKQFRPDEVVWLGDFWDVYCISRHEKNPQNDYNILRHELDLARDLLHETESILRPKKCVFLGGNHENRIERYIKANAPKLSGIFEEREILGIPSHYTYLGYGQTNYYKIGNLTCTHGYLAGENPAGRTVKKFHSSVIMGHTHKLQEHHVTDIHGNDFVGICAGWLGDRRRAAEYMNGVTDWSMGFVVTYHKPNGSFYYQLIHIKEEKTSVSAVFNGEVFVR